MHAQNIFDNYTTSPSFQPGREPRIYLQVPNIIYFIFHIFDKKQMQIFSRKHASACCQETRGLYRRMVTLAIANEI